MADRRDNGTTWAKLTGAPFTALGIGRSAIAAANALARAGAAVRAYDESTSRAIRDLAETELHPGVSTAFGDLPAPRPGEIYVVSPGFVADSAIYFEIKAAGYPLVDETEVFYHLMKARFPERPCQIVGITGTNGKTTITELTGHILRSAGRNVVVGGNVGRPLCNYLDELTPETVVVAELSEIHLLGEFDLHLDVAMITNLDYDHVVGLRVFGGLLERYHHAKWSITQNLGPTDTLVYNADCARTHSMVQFDHRDFSRVPVSGLERVSPGWWLGADGSYNLSDDCGVDKSVAAGGDVATVSSNGDQVLLGRHNHTNILLALAAVHATGLPLDGVKDALGTFRAPNHRINVLSAMPPGLVIIDDSKSTNPPAALAAVEIIRTTYPGQKPVWIGGGQTDCIPRDELVAVLAGFASSAVLLGESGGSLAKLLEPMIPCRLAGSMQEAVRLAFAELPGGAGVIMLSPAAKSLDMFRDYAHRAAAFRSAVSETLASGNR